MIKLFLISIAVCWCSIALQAQTKYPPVDKSPMDMSYYPIDYPLLKIQNKASEPLVARVIFSRPQKSGRVIFGELLNYGEVWRLGANEATEIEFYKNVTIGITKIKKGRYTLYCVPTLDKWTLILNRETDTWGAFKYDDKKDIVRIDAIVQKQSEVLDSFVMVFEKAPKGANLIIAWDDLRVNFPIGF